MSGVKIIGHDSERPTRRSGGWLIDLEDITQIRAFEPHGSPHAYLQVDTSYDRVFTIFVTQNQDYFGFILPYPRSPLFHATIPKKEGAVSEWRRFHRCEGSPMSDRTLYRTWDECHHCEAVPQDNVAGIVVRANETKSGYRLVEGTPGQYFTAECNARGWDPFSTFRIVQMWQSTSGTPELVKEWSNLRIQRKIVRDELDFFKEHYPEIEPVLAAEFVGVHQ